MRFGLVVMILAAAGLAALSTACGGNGGQSSPTGSLPEEPSGAPAQLSLVDWAERICALSAEAAGTLDVPDPENADAMTLGDRKRWVAEVLAPRVEALSKTADEMDRVRPPSTVATAAGEFQDFHRLLQLSLADIAAAMGGVVVAAKFGSEEEVRAANDVFIRAQAEVIDSLYGAWVWLTDDEMRAALGQPEDCGVVSEVRARYCAGDSGPGREKHCQ